MHKIDWSGIASTIALITAIISPIITTILNNRHQIKMHNINFYESHRAEAIENYLKATGYAIQDQSSLSEQYGKHLAEIYLYLPEELWDYIDKIDAFLRQSQFDAAKSNFISLCKALHKNPPRFK